jgi:aspartate-semialdehyde dehydrogenase
MSKANWRPAVAVVGSTGLVGSMMIRVLDERKIRARYYYFNSKNEVTAEKIGAIKPDFVLMAVSAELSARWTPLFVGNGAVVIDNSSHYRMHENVPLVIPEINAVDIWGGAGAYCPYAAAEGDADDICACGGRGKGSSYSISGRVLPRKRSPRNRMPSAIIANPNCSTIGAVTALAPLERAYRIKRVVYSTYQSVSGAGTNPQFTYPIENNVLPQIDGFLPNGNTKEEEKMINETKKILHRPDIAVSATCVRVPVPNCHSVSVNIEFFEKPDIAEVRKILANAKGVVLLDDPAANVYPVPAAADGTDEVFVGRVRLDADRPNTINLWTVCDNLRKGAATNAVQILEMLLKGAHYE